MLQLKLAPLATVICIIVCMCAPASAEGDWERSEYELWYAKVESAAQQFRAFNFQQFTNDRNEYARRRFAGQNLLDLWRRRGATPTDSQRLVSWFQIASRPGTRDADGAPKPLPPIPFNLSIARETKLADSTPSNPQSKPSKTASSRLANGPRRPRREPQRPFRLTAPRDSVRAITVETANQLVANSLRIKSPWPLSRFAAAVNDEVNLATRKPSSELLAMSLKPIAPEKFELETQASVAALEPLNTNSTERPHQVNTSAVKVATDPWSAEFDPFESPKDQFSPADLNLTNLNRDQRPKLENADDQESTNIDLQTLESWIVGYNFGMRSIESQLSEQRFWSPDTLRPTVNELGRLMSQRQMADMYLNVLPTQDRGYFPSLEATDITVTLLSRRLYEASLRTREDTSQTDFRRRRQIQELEALRERLNSWKVNR